jgi:glycosyltransferase involved in cell wall biosynthesis
MQEKICVSIIIPVYNGEPFIKKCIKSILNQNFKQSYEIIMIDDGSEDKSAELIKQYYLPNLKLHSLPVNSGPAAARNEGIKQAIGEYIFFLDVDDDISHNTLEILYNIAKEENCEYVCSDFKRIENSENQRDNVFNYSSDMIFDNKKIIEAMKKEVNDPTLGHLGLFGCNGRLIKRSIISKNNILFEEKFMLLEDKIFCWDVLGYVKKAIYMRKQLYSYFVYPNFNTAITKLIDIGWPFENFKIIKKHINKSLKNRGENDLEVIKYANQGLIFHIIQVLVSVSRSIVLKKIDQEKGNKFRKDLINKILSDEEVSTAIKNYTISDKESKWIPRAIRVKSRILLELACNLRANEVLKRRRTGKE